MDADLSRKRNPFEGKGLTIDARIRCAAYTPIRGNTHAQACQSSGSMVYLSCVGEGADAGWTHPLLAFAVLHGLFAAKA